VYLSIMGPKSLILLSLSEAFLSVEMWGYIGPLAVVICGYAVAKKSQILGVFYFIFECLIVSHYLELVEATPDYWWHIMIILLGGIFTFIYSLWDRR
jgi:hypothetical protein